MLTALPLLIGWQTARYSETSHWTAERSAPLSYCPENCWMEYYSAQLGYYPVQRYYAPEPNSLPVFEVLDFLTAVTSVSVGFEEDDTVCELFLMVVVVLLVSISSFADVSAETIAVTVV